MKISIGFSTPVKFKIGAKLLQLWQKADFSHTYIKFEFDALPSIIFHAAHGMVHAIAEDTFLEYNKVVHEVQLPKNGHPRLLVECIFKAGKKYGHIELIKIFGYDLLMNLGIKLKMSNSEGYICSELVGNVLANHFGYIFNKPYFLLTPKDILIKLKE